MVHNQPLLVGGQLVSPVKCARNPSVLLDAELTMDVQASAVVKGCFYQLRQFRSVRRSLTIDARCTVVTAFVASRLDYCNAVLYGAAKPLSNGYRQWWTLLLDLLVDLAWSRYAGSTRHTSLAADPATNWVQSCSACLRLCPRYLSTCPSYFCGICTPLTEVGGRVRLRYAHRGDLCVPSTRTEFGKRSFRVAAPRTWNSISVRQPSADSSSNLGSKLISSNAPTYDFYLRELLRSELTYLLTYGWLRLDPWCDLFSQLHLEFVRPH